MSAIDHINFSLFMDEVAKRDPSFKTTASNGIVADKTFTAIDNAHWIWSKEQSRYADGVLTLAFHTFADFPEWVEVAIGHREVEQKVTYEARGWSASVEQDVYEQGCIPEGSISKAGPEVFTGKTIEECVRACCSFVGVKPDDEAVTRDACEEPGRLDIQHTENDDALEPTPSELELWKEGKHRLWLVDYTFHIRKVTREIVPLTPAENAGGA